MKRIVILLEYILLLPPYGAASDCCFLFKLLDLYCEAICNNFGSNIFDFQPPTPLLFYANNHLPPPPPPVASQINPLPQPISPAYATLPQTFGNYDAYRSPQQPHVPSIPQYATTRKHQTSTVRIQSYKKKQSNFSGKKARNVKDEEVADLLDAIEEFHNRTLQVDETTKSIPFIVTDDSKCTNGKLKIIMLENIGEELDSSKKMIQLAAEEEFGGNFNIICSKNEVSFVINAELFCQATKGDVSCYAYKLVL
ncbi:unnamed protein product [Litomosoides sigmodontis]|uniref:Ground-like domain-containing protein n=1 Tax=Litomosoides sigmodontis TaxID=42156 RepID=A0A3P6U2J8_LITSI|nr:unnamed protein product [Litomosoides sigmodontis]